LNKLSLYYNTRRAFANKQTRNPILKWQSYRGGGEGWIFECSRIDDNEMKLMNGLDYKKVLNANLFEQGRNLLILT
jgi:hypothetical protein